MFSRLAHASALIAFASLLTACNTETTSSSESEDQGVEIRVVHVFTDATAEELPESVKNFLASTQGTQPASHRFQTSTMPNVAAPDNQDGGILIAYPSEDGQSYHFAELPAQPAKSRPLTY